MALVFTRRVHGSNVFVGVRIPFDKRPTLLPQTTTIPKPPYSWILNPVFITLHTHSDMDTIAQQAEL